MKRNVFFSFHFDQDIWRASQIRNMGMVEGNTPVSDNDWEKVKRGGDAAIEKWIDEQLKYRACAVVLVGAYTASRKWVIHEIKRAWSLGKGVVGIRIHNLEDRYGNKTSPGTNPFSGLQLNGVSFDQIVRLHDPPYSIGKWVYAHVNQNIASWVEDAISIRNKYE